MGHEITMVECIPYVSKLVALTCSTFVTDGEFSTSKEKLNSDLAKAQCYIYAYVFQVENLKTTIIKKDAKILSTISLHTDHCKMH